MLISEQTSSFYSFMSPGSIIGEDSLISVELGTEIGTKWGLKNKCQLIKSKALGI